MAEETPGDGWVWVAFGPEHRLIISFAVGPRNEATARELVGDMVTRLDGPLPLFVSDGYKVYAQMLLEFYGVEFTPPLTGKPGRPAIPRLVPPPELRYGQVVKHRKKNRVVHVEKRVVFGGDSVNMKDISTSKVERQNLNFRSNNRRLTRKSIGFSKRHREHYDHVALQVAEHNIVRPHLGLRVRNSIQTEVRKWIKRTPAMAAGLTNHIWSLKELLTFPLHKISVC